MFSLVDALILRPLPVAAPERLVTLSTTVAVNRGGRWGWSHPVWEQIHRRPDIFNGSFAWRYDRFNLRRGAKRCSSTACGSARVASPRSKPMWRPPLG